MCVFRMNTFVLICSPSLHCTFPTFCVSRTRSLTHRVPSLLLPLHPGLIVILLCLGLHFLCSSCTRVCLTLEFDYLPIVRAYEPNRPIGNGSQRFNGMMESGAALLLLAFLKMVRFFEKKFWKRSRQEPENTQANQTTNVDAERGRDSGGEYRSGKHPELIWLMGLIGLSHQIQTVEAVLGSQIRTKGPGINRFPPRLPQLKLPGTIVITQVSAVGWVIRVDAYPRDRVSPTTLRDCS